MVIGKYGRQEACPCVIMRRILGKLGRDSYAASVANSTHGGRCDATCVDGHHVGPGLRPVLVRLRYCPGQADRLKFSSWVGTIHGHHTGVIVHWAKMIEEKSGGRLKVTIYPGGTLGKPANYFDLMQNGIALRCLTWAGALDTIQQTIKTSAMIFMILIGATIFGYYLAMSQIPQHVVAAVAGMNLNR
jgi:hypothetical protein